VNLRPFVQFLRKGGVMIGAFAMAGLVLAGGYATAQTSQYESTAKLYVSTRSAVAVADLSKANSFDEAVVSSFAQIATSRIVLNPVISELGLHETAAHLGSRIRAEREPDTVVIDITTLDPSPVRAATLSNAVSAQVVKVAPGLTPSGSNRPRIVVVDRATPPLSPTYRSLASTLALGLLAGVAVGLIAAGLRGGSSGGGSRRASAPQMA
jgi:polysaccharide biosynthesis transport protein